MNSQGSNLDPLDPEPGFWARYYGPNAESRTFNIAVTILLLIIGITLGCLGMSYVFGYRFQTRPSPPVLPTFVPTNAAGSGYLAQGAQIVASPTPNIVPTSTSRPTEAVQPTPTAIPAVPTSGITNSEGWTLTWLRGADKDRGDGTTFRQTAEKWDWRKIAPELWPTFPNEPNPLVSDFRVVACADNPGALCVPDGLENAMDESNFCQQLAGESCRVPVAAEHYYYFTGDYDVPNIGSCEGSVAGTGCMLVLVNVGGVTSDFTGIFSQGFRLHARYFNGDALDMAIWALTSNGANSMLHMSSKLNPSGLQNAGANCSVPQGCEAVNVRVVFVSGNEPLLKLETEVSR